MKITITSIELKSPFKFFMLALYGMRITQQLKSSKVLDQKFTGIWTRHYTMTLWKNEEDLKNFANNGKHKEAMKKSRILAKEIRILTMEAEELPDWKTAKELIMKDARVYKF